MRDLKDRYEIHAWLPDANAPDVHVNLANDQTLKVEVNSKKTEKSDKANVASSVTELGQYEEVIQLPTPVKADQMKIALATATIWSSQFPKQPEKNFKKIIQVWPVNACRPQPRGYNMNNPNRIMLFDKTEKFSIATPDAQEVQFVGDFTNWQERPIHLRKEPNGVWRTAVRLEPGTHYYRFLVDGQWRDDPECPVKVPNPFGGRNAVRQVH